MRWPWSKEPKTKPHIEMSDTKIFLPSKIVASDKIVMVIETELEANEEGAEMLRQFRDSRKPGLTLSIRWELEDADVGDNRQRSDGE